MSRGGKVLEHVRLKQRIYSPNCAAG